jgi:TonB family protein
LNNWSTKGNFNPYTGKKGSKSTPSLNSYDSSSAISDSSSPDNLADSSEKSLAEPTIDKSPSNSDEIDTSNGTSKIDQPEKTDTAEVKPELSKVELEIKIQELTKRIENLERDAANTNMSGGQVHKIDSNDVEEKDRILNIYAPKPLYTTNELSRGLEGTCSFTFYVNAEGLPERIMLTSSTGHRELDLKSLLALKKWRFEAGKGGWVVQGFQWFIKKKYRVDLSLRSATRESGIRNAFYVKDIPGDSVSDRY